ncbi:MAG: Y-family DNA polymerase [Rhodothermales bacterium]
MFILVDCANFYCSCERVFQPSLRGKPVVVLSNNDGCIIARSEEVKHLGLRIGQPYFKIKDELKALNTHVFSSNYALYGDLSRRVHDILNAYANEVEHYSIDEAFLEVPTLAEADSHALGCRIRQHILQWTKIPVRVGIGPTKTLAKVASEIAKKRLSQVSVLLSPLARAHALRRMPVGEVWGIGPGFTKRLERHNVRTAAKLCEQRDADLRRWLGIVGLRTAWELRGRSCIALERVAPTRKSIIRSRSFSMAHDDLDTLREAVATHATRAAERARASKLHARVLTVFITTKNANTSPYYSNSGGTRLSMASHHTPTLIHAAHRILEALYRPCYSYRKAGVTLLDLIPETPDQAHLFTARDPKQAQLMRTLDRINRRYGRRSIVPASTGLRQPWAMRCGLRSPHFTGAWADLPVAHANLNKSGHL